MVQKVILVDDEDDTLELVRAVLDMAHIEVMTFDVAQEALDSLKSGNRPDLVLLDMRMPHISGPDFCRKVRDIAELKNLKIVFFTASSERNEGLLKEAGAKGYIFKPFDNADLVHQIRKYIAD